MEEEGQVGSKTSSADQRLGQDLVIHDIEQEKLVEVDGNQPIEQVQRALLEVIQQFMAERC